MVIAGGGAQVMQDIGGDADAGDGGELVHRAALGDDRPDRGIAVGDALDGVDRLTGGFVGDVSGELPEGSLDGGAFHGQMAFDDDLRTGGHCEVRQLALHDLDGLAVQGADEAGFVDTVGERDATDEGDRRITALDECVGHGLADLHPFLPDETDVLWRDDQAGHVLAVDHHAAGYRPVGPRAVRGARR